MKSADDATFNEVPDDYPRHPDIPAAVAGAKPKLALVRYEGRYYAEGFTPPERYERWQEFERQARFFAEKCIRNEHGKYAHLTRPEILAQYLTRFSRYRYGTPGECRWMIRRAGALIGWAIPQNAIEERPVRSTASDPSQSTAT